MPASSKIRRYEWIGLALLEAFCSAPGAMTDGSASAWQNTGKSVRLRVQCYYIRRQVSRRSSSRSIGFHLP